MPHSDFAMLRFDEHFTEDNPEETVQFIIEGNPVGPGYLLIQVADVEAARHRIRINGMELPGVDIAPSSQSDVWTAWMDRIPQGFLRQGTNAVAIHRMGDDSFHVLNLVVHWRAVD